VKQYDADGGTAVFLLKESALAADATVDVFAGVPLVLEESNVLKVTRYAVGRKFLSVLYGSGQKLIIA
jgi:hypothetical protein